MEYMPFTEFLSKFLGLGMLIMIIVAVIYAIGKNWWDVAFWVTMAVLLAIGPAIVASFVNVGLATLADWTNLPVEIPEFEGVTILAVGIIALLLISAATARHRVEQILLKTLGYLCLVWFATELIPTVFAYVRSLTS